MRKIVTFQAFSSLFCFLPNKNRRKLNSGRKIVTKILIIHKNHSFFWRKVDILLILNLKYSYIKLFSNFNLGNKIDLSNSSFWDQASSFFKLLVISKDQTQAFLETRQTLEIQAFSNSSQSLRPSLLISKLATFISFHSELEPRHFATLWRIWRTGMGLTALIWTSRMGAPTDKSRRIFWNIAGKN